MSTSLEDLEEKTSVSDDAAGVLTQKRAFGCKKSAKF